LIDQIQYATITKQSVTFTIVAVQLSVIQNKLERGRSQWAYSHIFPGMPIVLMTRDPRGVPIYIGRHDIIDYLKVTASSAIPWQTLKVDCNSLQIVRDNCRLMEPVG
jgi:hypothetical protein